MSIESPPFFTALHVPLLPFLQRFRNRSAPQRREAIGGHIIRSESRLFPALRPSNAQVQSHCKGCKNQKHHKRRSKAAGGNQQRV